ncbi:MAG TPA: hypothetical protein DD734_03960 [Firmicutes bacterium]|nr:hypothetical protein [Bacillota bacterium]
MSNIGGRRRIVFFLFLFILGCSRSILTQERGVQVGETLEYQVFIKGLPVGEQTLQIVGETFHGHRRVLEVRMRMKSYAAYALFFSYEENSLLYLDAQDITPVYLKKVITEKNDHREEEYDFGAETVNKKVTVQGEQPQVRQYEAKHPLLESLSLIYYFRSRPWRQEYHQFYYFTSKGPQAIDYQHRGQERIRVLADYQRADVIYDPVSQVSIWYSQDERVYPLRVQVNTNFGVLTARLTKITH